MGHETTLRENTPELDHFFTILYSLALGAGKPRKTNGSPTGGKVSTIP